MLENIIIENKQEEEKKVEEPTLFKYKSSHKGFSEYIIKDTLNDIIARRYDNGKIVIKKAPKTGDINFFELEYDELTKQKNVYKKNSFSEAKEQMDPDSMDVELDLFLNGIKQPKKD
jgi:hypothetical protein